jgi:predicted DCC family thiol-disulfide oxidoreductase YuxK
MRRCGPPPGTRSRIRPASRPSDRTVAPRQGRARRASAPSLTVLYDADCGFCRATLAALLRWDRRALLIPEAIQSPEGQRLLASVSPELRLASAHAVAPDGRIWSGGDVAAPIAELLPGGAPVALLARLLAAPARAGYSWVATHRTGLSRLVPGRAKAGAAAAIARHRERALARRG